MHDDTRSPIEKAEAFLQQQTAMFGGTFQTVEVAKKEEEQEEALPHITQSISQEVVATVEESPSEVSPAVISTVPEPIVQEEEKLPTSSVLPWKNADTLEELFSCIHTCTECKLGATRNNFVFGVGNPNADIMIVGEAPGADEDAQGEPFVGRAGQLLTKILAAINLSRSDVYIANIIKCRPPNNRVPEREEVDQCEPYLHKQIRLIKPKFILALGLTAANTLLKGKYKMSEVRGKNFDYQGATLMVTYHPAALLRNPSWKRATWEDVQRLRDMNAAAK